VIPKPRTSIVSFLPSFVGVLRETWVCSRDPWLSHLYFSLGSEENRPYLAPPHKSSSLEVGLCYISNYLGHAIGSIAGVQLGDAKLRKIPAHDGEINPVESLETV
jgi:hypothetical protein